MRGSDERSGSLFSYVDLEARVRRDHPLRAIRELANAALTRLDGGFRGALFDGWGGPRSRRSGCCGRCCCRRSIRIRSERQLMERLEFDLLFRWFVGLGVDDAVWDHSTFLEEPRPAAGRRDRGQVPGRGAGAAEGQAAAVERALLGGRHADRGLGLDEELPPQGRQDGDQPDGRAATRERNFHGEKRSNETHASTTDPEARLYRRATASQAKLCYHGPCPDGEPLTAWSSAAT